MKIAKEIDQRVVSLTKYWILESMALALTSFTQRWLTWVAQCKYSSKDTPKYILHDEMDTISCHAFLMSDQCQKVYL